MSFKDECIQEVTEGVWSTMLGMPLRLQWESAPPQESHDYVTSWVSISGSWSGTITIGCSSAAARRAAAAMFGVVPEEASAEEVNDAMGEVANIIGGNLKGLLTGPATLSLPSVAEGFDTSLHVPDFVAVQSTRFDSEGEPLVVTVFARTIPPPPPTDL